MKMLFSGSPPALSWAFAMRMRLSAPLSRRQSEDVRRSFSSAGRSALLTFAAHQTCAMPFQVGRQPGDTIACPIHVHSIDADIAWQISFPRASFTPAQPRSRDAIARPGRYRAAPSPRMHKAAKSKRYTRFIGLRPSGYHHNAASPRWERYGSRSYCPNRSAASLYALSRRSAYRALTGGPFQRRAKPTPSRACKSFSAP